MARITNSMACPLCGGATCVPETHGAQDVIRRKRQCTNAHCGHRFFTREVFERDIQRMPQKARKTSWTKENNPHV